MVNMARKEARGRYQIGIWSVERIRRGRWLATATGASKDGPAEFLTLGDAHLVLTGEVR